MHLSNGCIGWRQASSSAHEFLSPHDWEQLRAWLTLSARELDIVQLMLSDCSEAEMAHQLGISSHTVHTHLDRLYRKLDVSGRVRVVARVFEAYTVITPRGPSPAQPSAEQPTFAASKIG